LKGTCLKCDAVLLGEINIKFDGKEWSVCKQCKRAKLDEDFDTPSDPVCKKCKEKPKEEEKPKPLAAPTVDSPIEGEELLDEDEEEAVDEEEDADEESQPTVKRTRYRKTKEDGQKENEVTNMTEKDDESRGHNYPGGVKKCKNGDHMAPIGDFDKYKQSCRKHSDADKPAAAKKPKTKNKVKLDKGSSTKLVYESSTTPEQPRMVNLTLPADVACKLLTEKLRNANALPKGFKVVLDE
jgi:hypothetical protein